MRIDGLRRGRDWAASLAFDRTGVGLHAMTRAAGRQRVRPGDAYRWDGRRRGDGTFALLQHTLSGRGRLRVGGETLAVGPGETMLVTVPGDHVYDAAPGDGWGFVYLVLDGEEVLRAATRVVAQRGHVLMLPPALVDDLASLATQVRRRELASAYAASAGAYTLAMRLLEWSAAGPARRRPGEVERAARLVRERLGEPIDVADMAAAAGWSRAHFTREFVAATGETPGAYLLRRRLRRAVRLLETTDLPVKRISHECGFRDADTFQRAFKRAYGMRPSDVRRSGVFARR